MAYLLLAVAMWVGYRRAGWRGAIVAAGLVLAVMVLLSAVLLLFGGQVVTE